MSAAREPAGPATMVPNPSPVWPSISETDKALRPLIYGYLRVWTDTSDEDAARTERKLINYAEREGFTVAEIFVERPYLPVTAFDGLIQAIARTGTKDIVVPDLSHFCPYHRLGSSMKAILEHVAGARVWVIRP